VFHGLHSFRNELCHDFRILFSPCLSGASFSLKHSRLCFHDFCSASNSLGIHSFQNAFLYASQTLSTRLLIYVAPLHLCRVLYNYNHFYKRNALPSSELSIHDSYLDACAFIDLCTTFKRFFGLLLASSMLACFVPSGKLLFTLL
jgi:hypothetical protein